MNMHNINESRFRAYQFFLSSNIDAPTLHTCSSTHAKTAATRPPPTVRASKTDLVTTFAVYRMHYSHTNRSLARAKVW